MKKRKWEAHKQANGKHSNKQYAQTNYNVNRQQLHSIFKYRTPACDTEITFFKYRTPACDTEITFVTGRPWADVGRQSRSNSATKMYTPVLIY